MREGAMPATVVSEAEIRCCAAMDRAAMAAVAEGFSRLAEDRALARPSETETPHDSDKERAR
jgi:hypothetical protein